MATYTNPADILAVFCDKEAPRNNSATGYGPKIPTRFRVKMTDGRIHRVYCAIFANAGTVWVRFKGQELVLDTDTQYRLEESRAS